MCNALITNASYHHLPLFQDRYKKQRNHQIQRDMNIHIPLFLLLAALGIVLGAITATIVVLLAVLVVLMLTSCGGNY